MKKNKINENEIVENIEKLEKEIKNKKQIPQQDAEIINKKVFTNVFIAALILVFGNLLNLGALNIETNIYITDLKVFTMALIILTVILFETSYKKEDGSICIHGLETFCLALFTMGAIYIYKLYFDKYELLVALVGFLFAIYYTFKSIIIYFKLRKKYKSSLNDINEIIKK